MRSRVIDKPDFSVVRVEFEGAGDLIHCEPGAMVARSTSIVMSTNMPGGFFGSVKRRLLGGESLFENTFTASQNGETLWLAPAPEGDVEQLDLDGSGAVYLASGAYLARGNAVQVDTKWAGARGFFSGAGLFLLKCAGAGPLLFCAYGGIHAVDVAAYGGRYVVDTNHVVGFTEGLQWNVTRVGGLKSLFLSGEGLVCQFSGQGRVWVQTRNPGALAAFLNPFRPVKKKKSELQLPSGD